MYLVSDLGGTNAVAALCNAEGSLCSEPVHIPVPGRLPAEQLLDVLVSFWKQTAGEHEVKAVLTGFPSKLEQGRMVACDNLPTLKGVLLEAELEKRAGVPIFCAPDALCFAAGAWENDPEHPRGITVGITLGTGIGFAALHGGTPFGGPLSGEVWKAPYRGGYLESVLSAAWLQKVDQERTGQSRTGKELAAAAQAGEPDARRIMEEYARALGTLLCYTVGMMDPQRIYVGGGISGAWEFFEPVVRQQLEENSLRPELSIQICRNVDSIPLYGVRRLYRTGENFRNEG